ncbi:hypothetical protein [uncultured Rikenella sp.]|uniref:hypothetical protein n=1 Tax=uncultured Rikenella sp. TaxID=368003 RepID=UPI002729A083|nr:hypothetical protein [uncultured Rikenella sp.]
MAKKDVLDTVDIFFGTGKAGQQETDTQQEIAEELDRLETELPALEAEAERLLATRSKGNARKTVREEKSAIPERRISAPAPTPSTGRRTAIDRVVSTEETALPAEMPERERISFVLPYEQVEYLKNYKYCRALADGDPQYTLTEALIEAIELLRKHTTYEVFERPAFVRVREKKPRK